jgi:hypothetical protein
MLKFFPGDLVCQVSHVTPTYKKYKTGVVKRCGSKGSFVQFHDEVEPKWVIQSFLWFVTKDKDGNIVAVKHRPPAPKDPPTPIPEKPIREEPEEEEVIIMRPKAPTIVETAPAPKTEVQKKVEALSAAGYDPFRIWQDMLQQAAALGKTLLADQSAAVETAHEAYLAAAEEVEYAQKLLAESQAKMEAAKAAWTDAAEKLTLVSKQLGSAK